MATGTLTKKSAMQDGLREGGSNLAADRLALRMLELMAQGKIDRQGAQIMSMRLEWPRPSMRTIARRLGIDRRTLARKCSMLIKDIASS